MVITKLQEIRKDVKKTRRVLCSITIELGRKDTKKTRRFLCGVVLELGRHQIVTRREDYLGWGKEIIGYDDWVPLRCL